MIMAAESRDFPNHPEVESISRSNFLGRRKDTPIPRRRAMTGSPRKSTMVLKDPVPNGSEGRPATVLTMISTSGIINGRKDFAADGAFFTF